MPCPIWAFGAQKQIAMTSKPSKYSENIGYFIQCNVTEQFSCHQGLFDFHSNQVGIPMSYVFFYGKRYQNI